jgi:hypothetical protein
MSRVAPLSRREKPVTTTRNTAIALAGLAVLSVAVAVASFFEVSPWINILLSGVPWVVGLGMRYGYTLAAPIALVVGLWVIIFSLMGTAWLRLPMPPTVALVFCLLCVGGCWYTWSMRRVVMVPAIDKSSRLGRLGWTAASAGAVLWLAAQVASYALPAFDRLNWVMRNDAVNNLMFARISLHDGGIPVGSLENPAPLPAGLLALSLAPGRASIPGARLLEHDLLATSWTWGGLIMIVCIASGATAGSIALRAGARRWVATSSAAAGSLMVLSWFFTGYPIEYGFLNTHVALPVLLAVVLMCLHAARAPWLALSGIAMGATVMLAVWSPLVVIPLAVGLATMVANWRRLRRTRGWPLAALVAAALQLLIYGICVSMPSFLAQKQALSGAGGIFDPGKWVIFALGAAVIVAAIFLFRNLMSPEFLSLSFLVIGGWAGLGVLLFVSRRAPDPWTYYPIKFAWLASLVYLVMLLGLIVALIDRYFRRRTLRAFGMSVLAGLLAVLVLWTPFIATSHVSMNPVDRLLRSQTLERFPTIAKYILAYTNPDTPEVMWQSNFDIEAEVNIWLIQLWAYSDNEDAELRVLAYTSYSDRSPQMLCRIADLAGPKLVVHTANPMLEQDLRRACPSTRARIVVEGK